MQDTISFWFSLDNKGSQDKKEEKKETASVEMSFSRANNSCPFLIPDILLLALCFRVERWKILVF